MAYLKEKIFVFNMIIKSHCLFPFPILVYRCNDDKDIRLAEYKEKLIMTHFDKEEIEWKYES